MLVDEWMDWATLLLLLLLLDHTLIAIQLVDDRSLLVVDEFCCHGLRVLDSLWLRTSLDNHWVIEECLLIVLTLISSQTYSVIGMIGNNAHWLVQITVFVLLPLRLIVCSFHLESLAEVDILGSDKGTLLLLAAIFRLVFTSIIPNYLDDHGAVTFSHHTLNVEVSGIYRWLA